jgi:hypothetical protein
MPRTTIEVPDEWAVAAEESDVSLAEYCRRMARAGRRQFGYDYEPTTTPTDGQTLDWGSDSHPSSDAIERFVYRNLGEKEGRDATELVDLIEEDIVAAADALVADGRAKYRRSRGGWIRASDE